MGWERVHELGLKSPRDALGNVGDLAPRLRLGVIAVSLGDHGPLAQDPRRITCVTLKHVSRDFLGGAFAVHAPGLRGSNRLRIGLGAPLGGSDPRFCSIGGDCASYRLRQDDRERPDPRPWIYTEASIGERAIARTEPICLFAGYRAFCGRAAVGESLLGLSADPVKGSTVSPALSRAGSRPPFIS